MSEAPWYAAGLAFECTRCGHCCTGEPGTVLVDEGELTALRAHLALEEAAFREQCTRTLPSGRVVLREKANGECVFWSAREGCTVYALRPRQCRTWPFWRNVVRSSESWAEAARSCPGIGRGALHSTEHVRATSERDGTLSSAISQPPGPHAER